MATGSDPFLPGTLYEREHIRKSRMKRFAYGAAAFVVFIICLFSGLAWYGSDPAPQTALQQHRPLEPVPAPPVKALTPPSAISEPAEPVLAAPPIAPPPAEPQEAMQEDADAGAARVNPFAPPSFAMTEPAAAPPVESSEQTAVETQADAAPEPEAPKPQLPASSTGRYLVQIGAFRNEANARNLVAKLRGKGYQPYVHTVQDQRNRDLHRVILGRAPGKAQAQAVARAFERAERMETLVMLAPSPPGRSAANAR